MLKKLKIKESFMDHMLQYPLVKAKVASLILTGTSFTAWDVTGYLTDEGHPVDHSIVRPSVHTLMLDITENGDYAVELSQFPSGQAFLYTPTKLTNVPMYIVASGNGASKAVNTIGYDHIAGDLLIEFQSGGTYRYNDVPAEVFAEFLNAHSKGKFFHERIKDVYGT